MKQVLRVSTRLGEAVAAFGPMGIASKKATSFGSETMTIGGPGLSAGSGLGFLGSIRRRLLTAPPKAAVAA